NDQVKGDFGQARGIIMVSQSKTAMEPKNWRQCARDEKKVIEITVEEQGMNARFQTPAIDRIRGATGQEKRISPIAEAAHRWGLKPRLHSLFLHGYFNALFLIPCALPPILWLHRRFG